MQWSSHPYSLPFWAKGTHTTKLKLVCNQLSLTKSEHVCLFLFCFVSFFGFRHKTFPLPFQLLCFIPAIIVEAPALLFSTTLTWNPAALLTGAASYITIFFAIGQIGWLCLLDVSTVMIQSCSDLGTRLIIFTWPDVALLIFSEAPLAIAYPSWTLGSYPFTLFFLSSSITKSWSLCLSKIFWIFLLYFIARKTDLV